MKTKGPQAPARADAATEVPGSQAGAAAAADDYSDDEDDEEEGDDKEKTKNGKKKGEGDDAGAAAAAPVVVPAAAAVAPAAAALDTNALLARSAEISNMCTVAGAPALAAEFIRSGKTVEQAKAALFDKLSAGSLQLVNAVDTNSTARGESDELLVNAMRNHVKAEESRRKGGR